MFTKQTLSCDHDSCSHNTPSAVTKFHGHTWKFLENSLYFVQLIGKSNWKEKSNQEVFIKSDFQNLKLALRQLTFVVTVVQVTDNIYIPPIEFLLFILTVVPMFFVSVIVSASALGP